DPLRGQPATHLLRIVEEAVADAQALERAAIGLRIDTSRGTAEEVADAVLTRSGWPGEGHGRRPMSLARPQGLPVEGRPWGGPEASRASRIYGGEMHYPRHRQPSLAGAGSPRGAHPRPGPHHVLDQAGLEARR